jgi:predicted LPLAT superfamily acyltransferase
VNLMSVTDIGPDTAIAIKEKLERGEWVAIVGDRIAVNPQRGGEWRVIWSRSWASQRRSHRGRLSWPPSCAARWC